MSIKALPRTLATCLCKTRNWCLVEQALNDIYWCGTEEHMLDVGEAKPLEEMLQVIQQEDHPWTLMALSEPAFPEADAPRTLDFLFPLVGNAAIDGHRTPSGILNELLRYITRSMRYIGCVGYLRGFPGFIYNDDSPAPSETKLVNPYPLFLAHSTIIGSEDVKGIVDPASDTADHLWYNQCIQNLFPAKGYYQKLYGQGDKFWIYQYAAPESFDDAVLLYELELATLNTYLADSHATGDHKLFRAVSPEVEEYNDLLLAEDSYHSMAINPMTQLHRKFCCMNSRANSLPLVDIDISKNATERKKELLTMHLHDAAEPFVRLGWNEEWVR